MQCMSLKQQALSLYAVIAELHRGDETAYVHGDESSG